MNEDNTVQGNTPRNRLDALMRAVRPRPAADVTPVVPMPSSKIAPPADASLLGGRYRLGSELARGGMGVVFRAVDERFSRQVAVKLLLDGLEHRRDLADRFAYEAEVTARLQHPGVPPVHDLGTTPNGRPFMVMKLIHGRTLGDLLDERAGPADSLPRWVGVFEQVAQAVAYAHGRGVVHRDLKPENVMVGKFGEVQVMDWGIAKEPGVGTPARDGETPTPDAGRTLVGAILGTPGYMAPEQARGETDTLTPRADVFALGAILCEILTGRPPIDAPTGEEVVRRTAAGHLADARAALDACGADAELVALARRCLAADAADRPEDGAAVARAVADYQCAVQDRLRRAAADKERRKRRRVQVGLGVAIAAILLGGGAFGAFRESQAALRSAKYRADRATYQTAMAREEAARLKAEAEVRARAARNRQALADLLDRVTDDLKVGEAGHAASLLGEAESRLPGGDGQQSRFDTLKAELAMLRRLALIDQRRWGLGGRRRVQTPETHRAWEEAFRDYGLARGATPPAEAARRINASPIRARLMTSLETWFTNSGRGDDLRAWLDAADPDPFRSAARAATLREAVADWAGRGEAVLKDQPVWFDVGHTALMDGKPDLRLLKAAHRRHPDNVFLLMALSDAGGNRSIKDALRQAGWCRAVLAADPLNPAAWNNLGVALYRSGDPSEAEHAFGRATDLLPNRATFFVNLGNARMALDDLAGAAAAYREAARLDPDSPSAQFRWAKICMHRKDWPAAVLALRRVVWLDPRRHEPRTHLGLALGQTGDLRGAAAALYRAVELRPDLPATRVKLAAVLGKAGRWGECLAAARAAVRVGPKHADAHHALGLALLKTGDPRGAAASFREAIRLHPRANRSKKLLKAALAQLEDTD